MDTGASPGNDHDDASRAVSGLPSAVIAYPLQLASCAFSSYQGSFAAICPGDTVQLEITAPATTQAATIVLQQQADPELHASRVTVM
jgi:hypothetical protein